MVLACVMMLALGLCYGASPCYGVSPCYNVSLCYGLSPCYNVSPCYSISMCYGINPCHVTFGEQKSSSKETFLKELLPESKICTLKFKQNLIVWEHGLHITCSWTAPNSNIEFSASLGGAGGAGGGGGVEPGFYKEEKPGSPKCDTCASWRQSIIILFY